MIAVDLSGSRRGTLLRSRVASRARGGTRGGHRRLGGGQAGRSRAACCRPPTKRRLPRPLDSGRSASNECDRGRDPLRGNATARQRRRRRARQVRDAGPPVVGPRKRDVRTAAQDESAAPRLDRADRRRARRQARRRRRVRRRHPDRSDGGARRRRTRHRPRRQGARRRAAAQARIGQHGGVPARRRRSARARDAGRVRHRHLHGNARARARSGVDRRRLRGVGPPGRSRRRFDDQPQSQVVCAGRRRGGVCPWSPAERHARLREVPARPPEVGVVRPPGRTRVGVASRGSPTTRSRERFASPAIPTSTT